MELLKRRRSRKTLKLNTRLNIYDDSPPPFFALGSIGHGNFTIVVPLLSRPPTPFYEAKSNYPVAELLARVPCPTRLALAFASVVYEIM